MDLEANQEDHVLVFRLSCRGQTYQIPHPLDDGIRLELEEQIESVLLASGPNVEHELELNCGALWRIAIDFDLAVVLASSQEALFIRSDRRTSSMPWELLHTGKDHLGILKPIGRQFDVLVKEYQLSALLNPIEEPTNGFTALVIGNPTEDLPGSDTEATQVAELFRAWGDCILLTGKDAYAANVILHLTSQPFDVIHFAGHSFISKDREDGYLMLANRIRMGASELQNCFKGKPFVFLSSCVSDRCPESASKASPPVRAASLVEAFIIGNQYGRAPAVIASNVDLFDSSPGFEQVGAKFAVNFYKALRSGVPVGEALRLTRYESRESYGGGLWAPYVLYGDPNDVVRFACPSQAKDSNHKVDESSHAHSDVEQILSGPICRRLAAPSGGETKDFPADHDTGQGLLDSAPLDSQARQILVLAFMEMRNLGGRFLVSMDLLLGVLRSDSPVVSRFLGDSGADPQAIRMEAEEFCRGLDPRERARTGTSPNVFASLLEAAKFARAANRNVIGVEDLAFGILACVGSSASDLLVKYGVKRQLSPSTVILRQSDFEAPAWTTLLQAQAVAEKTRSSVFSSDVLAKGMCSSPASYMSRALARVGLELKIVPTALSEGSTEIRAILSESASATVARARMTSITNGRKLVSEKDLFQSFIKCGGGTFETRLSDKGYDIRDLDRLFLDDGKLDLTCFENGAAEALVVARKLASVKGYTVIGRRHLLYGLLTKNKTLIAALRLQGSRADRVSLAYLDWLETGPSKNDNLELTDTMMNPELNRVLFNAARLEDKRSASGKISDISLAQAWVGDGGGEAGDFLRQFGVNNGLLRRDLENG